MPPIYSKEWKKITIRICGDPRQSRTSPCEAACPLGNNIQQVHALLAKGKTDEALTRLHARNPFPGITGRICPHPCESNCNRGSYDEALAIPMLERFAADNGHPTFFRSLSDSGKHIAIVGGGPAGLSAARFASLFGHEVTVYERAPIIGGIPRQAIPDFRLPKDVVDREIGNVLSSDIQIHTNVTVGQDILLSSLLKKYDACILATGLWKERQLPIPGSEHLVPAVSWLQKISLQHCSLAGKRVVILGGGGVALDCALTARRLKAVEVHLVCLEAIVNMRIPAEELVRAQAEGVRMHNGFLAQAVASKKNGVQLTACPVEHFLFDTTGCLHPVFAPGEVLKLEADLVLCASGLIPDETVFSGLLVDRTPEGLAAVDPVSCETSIPGLFAAGDIANGPSSVAKAIGSGRDAAIAVHGFLSGREPGVNTDFWIDETGQVQEEQCPALSAPHTVLFQEMLHLDFHSHAARQRPSASMSDMNFPFAELACGFDANAAKTESTRCLHCGHCMECGCCVESCPGHILEMSDDGPQVVYPNQCWHCGCCRIACPTSSIAYRFPLSMLV